ncbi:MAG: endonuclease domain-containing protein, partial [Dehalococcoidia bacterium]|nr:endonuclease domain-containing protein [Dehalococcoidia bacterium]
DFVSFEKRLVIDIDGSQHNENETTEKNDARTRRLEAEGFQLLRFWNNDVIMNIEGVLETIRNALV